MNATILIVCTANRFRSPIAEGCLRRVLRENCVEGDWELSSAGTWAVEGLEVIPSPGWVQDAFGLDLTAHRSRQVTGGLLAAAHLVAVMEAGHQEALRVEFPAVADRVRLLSELCGAAPYDIPDPLGKPLEDHLAIGREIIDLIHQGWRSICDQSQINP